MPNIMITLKWETLGEEWKNESLDIDKDILKKGYGIGDNDCIILSLQESSLIGKTLTGDTIVISAHAGNGTLGFSKEQRLSALGLFKILTDLQDIQHLKKVVLYACSMGVGDDSQGSGSFASTLASAFAERDMDVDVYAPRGICASDATTNKFTVRKTVEDVTYLLSEESWLRCQSSSKKVTLHITSEPEMPIPVIPEKVELGGKSEDDWLAEIRSMNNTQ